MSSRIVALKNHEYVVVLNKNTNVSTLQVGPGTFATRAEDELFGPHAFVVVPPRCYCRIRNPVVKDEKSGLPRTDGNGNVVLRHGEEEIRMHGPPFPLYPGEELAAAPAPLQVLPADTALRVQAIADFADASGKARVAGDEWLVRGPATYFPRVEERVVELVKATLIERDCALRVRARRTHTTEAGVKRAAGSEWLVRECQMFLPRVEEEVVELVRGLIVTPHRALCLRAIRNYTDVFGSARRAGESWLVTAGQCDVYIPDVGEQVQEPVALTVLTAHEYCVVVNAVNPATGELRLGHRELRTGPRAFFLHPGEELERGIEPVYVLGQDEALLLQATAPYMDGKVERAPGSQWLIRGPRTYTPPIAVRVVERRSVIALDAGEGVYVRDLHTGRVRGVQGKPHLLEAHEELWPKALPKAVEELVALGAASRDRSQLESAVSYRGDKSRVVSYRVPYNAATQVYDYKLRRARVLFGPQLVMLGPDEEFTLLSLSGGNPKQPHQIKSLALFLGPDFMTDSVVVETSDHLSLQLRLAYNWRFDVDRSTDKTAARIFQVPDFVGDACSAIASRVRGAVAAVTFDAFHKESALIIRRAVFGAEKEELKFPANGLVVTGVDVQSVDPIDPRTRDALQKSVQMAIEITSRSQEAAAQHVAEREQQQATGTLERMQIDDDCLAERLTTALLQRQTTTAIIEAIGDHTADAEAKKKAADIRGRAVVTTARLAAEAARGRVAGEIELLRLQRARELEVRKQTVAAELEAARKDAAVEVERFRRAVEAISPSTLESMARAGPELQAQLLEGLGLSGFLVTDGKTPLNLFDASNALMGGTSQ